MKRFHVHVAVPQLQPAIAFYSRMFGAAPAVVKTDYAKWMLEDPRLNFAISQRGATTGVNHLGFQVDDAEELAQLHSRLQSAESGVLEEKSVACCYAKSDKYWVKDPAGIPWESYRTLGSVPFYDGETAQAAKGGCCAPEDAASPVGCCAPEGGLKAAGKAKCCA